MKPGDVGVINSNQAGVTLSTGIMVIYSDDVSFAFMTPQGHPFAGWITFSAQEQESGSTSAQVQLLIRPSDPLYDVAFAMFAGRKEDRMWQHTLGSVAQHFGSRSEVETEVEVVDRKRQWRQAKNIWHNAAIRSALYTMGAPFRWIGRLFKRSR